jgi:predicted phage terminase large subunit-like protein
MPRRVRAWDLAATQSGGDFTAGIRMAQEGPKFTIEHLVHGRWSPYERDKIIVQTAAFDPVGTEIVIEQEPGASGVAQIDDLIAKLAGYTVRGHRVTGDKLTRAGPLASQAEAGNVLLVAGEWNSELIDQLASFPTDGVHDDIVDAASLAFACLAVKDDNPFLGIFSARGTKGWQPSGVSPKRKSW